MNLDLCTNNNDCVERRLKNMTVLGHVGQMTFTTLFDIAGVSLSLLVYDKRDDKRDEIRDTRDDKREEPGHTSPNFPSVCLPQWFAWKLKIDDEMDRFYPQSNMKASDS